MSLLTSPNLYKASAILYGLIVPAHLKMGFDVIYPTLSKITNATSEDKIGKTGARNCWNLVATSLFTLALMNWKWSNSGGPQTMEETALLLVNSAHVALNGFNYAQAGDTAAGSALLIVSTLNAAGFALQAR